MLYNFDDIDNWIFAKLNKTTLKQKLYWFCSIRSVFKKTFTALQDQLDDEILGFQCIQNIKIPGNDALSQFSYQLALDAILTWANPKLKMQCIVAQPKHKKDLPRGIVLYNEETNLNGELYVYIHYLIAQEKGQKIGLGLTRSVLLQYPPGTQFYLEVHKINQTAIHLYEKLGFSIENNPNFVPDFNEHCAHLMGLQSSRELLQSIPQLLRSRVRGVSV